MPEPLQFRLATADNIPRLAAMVNAAFAVEQFLEGTRTDPDKLAEMLEKGQLLIAEEAGQLLGSLYMEFHDARGYLGMLAVDPTAQGQGIARQLTAEAEARFRSAGCRVVEIIVLNMRPELVPIYSRWGFVEAGTTEFTPVRAVRPGVQIHGIRMEKQLC